MLDTTYLPQLAVDAHSSFAPFSSRSGLGFLNPLAAERQDVSLDLAHARFAPTYTASRERFRRLAQDAGATLTTYPFPGAGPDGEALSIDFAEISGQSAVVQSTLVVVGGVHGSEGFAGAAVQEEVLAAKPQLPAGARLIFVHALNPFGMAHDRRTTERNVDLNRNCTSERYGADDDYDNVRGLLSPADVHELERSLNRLMSLSHAELRDILCTIAPGQYRYHDDPFFGGWESEENIEILYHHLEGRKIAQGRSLFLDLHTGLGAAGEETLFYLGTDRNTYDQLSRSLGERHVLRDPHATVPYASKVRGNVAEALSDRFASAGGGGFVYEIGTYPDLLIPTLVLERFCCRFPSCGLSQASRTLSREFFTPSDGAWRIHLLRSGTDVLRRAADAAFG